MNEEHKKNIHAKYKIALQKGERFWPDSIYKDLIVSFAIFMILILLATFIGVPGEPKADPSDAAYIPRPEWYFLFLFKFLALWGQIPVLGKIEWIATAVIPAIALIILFVLPLTDKNPYRYYSRRILAITIMGVFLTGVVVLTMISNIPTTVLPLLQFLAGLIIPTLAYIAIIALGFLARKKAPQTGHAQVWIAVAASAVMLVLGGLVMMLAPKPEATTEVQVANTVTEKIVAGQDLYSINCTECHGEDGKVTIITGVKGLEDKAIMPINSNDVMYTLNDQALADIISYGRPDSGMTPFGRTYGGELSPSDIDYLVTFLRYSWDNRVEMPKDAAAASSIPELQAGEVPSWDVHITALTKRYCLSCHRPGKTNNNYVMTSYDEMLNSGDNAPVVAAGDPYSLLLQLINGHEGLDPKTNKAIRQMPVTKLLNQKYIDMFTLWIMSGMPQTKEDAAALQPVPITGDAIYLKGDAIAGAAVFTAQCEKCHGAAGAVGVENPGSDDGTVPSLNPIDPEIKNADAQIFAVNLDLYLQSGSTPSGTAPKLNMPAFGRDKTLSQQDIANVIAYLISLNP
jgi:mono/diheme cytochrome c family protein